MTLNLDISMSLDGYIAGPNATLEHPLGEGGELLHQWLFPLAGFRERHGMTGGEVNEDTFHAPVFVLTLHARERVVKQGGTSFTFVTTGIEDALEQARAAAGRRPVSLGGGADVARQYLEARLLDELRVHLVPVLLGDGVRLFDGRGPVELEPATVVASPSVTHLTYRPRVSPSRH